MNPDAYVLSNTELVDAIIALNFEVARQTGLETQRFKLTITGGDRYMKDDKVLSKTDDQTASDSKPNTRHRQDRGALAVDLRVPKNVSKDVVLKAAKTVGFTEIATKYTDKHIHLALPLSAKDNYVNQDRLDECNIPTFVETQYAPDPEENRARACEAR